MSSCFAWPHHNAVLAVYNTVKECQSFCPVLHLQTRSGFPLCKQGLRMLLNTCCISDLQGHCLPNSALQASKHKHLSTCLKCQIGRKLSLHPWTGMKHETGLHVQADAVSSGFITPTTLLHMKGQAQTPLDVESSLPP